MGEQQSPIFPGGGADRLGPPLLGGEPELAEDLFTDRVEYLLLVPHVVVQGHGLHPEFATDVPHGHGLQPILVHDPKRGADDSLPGEWLPVGSRPLGRSDFHLPAPRGGLTLTAYMLAYSVNICRKCNSVTNAGRHRSGRRMRGERHETE